MQSPSEAFRIQGNEKYFRATQSLGPVSFQNYLNEAMLLYNKALNLASDPYEQGSIYKNLGMTYHKMNSKESNVSQQLENLNSSCKNFIQSHTLGTKSKREKAWLDKLEEEMEKNLSQIVKFQKPNERIKSYYKIFFMVPNEIANVKIFISLSLTRELFNEAVVCLDEKDYKSTLKMLADGQQPLETARFCLRKFESLINEEYEDLWDEFNDLQESFKTTEVQAKCLQKLEEANKLYKADISKKDPLLEIEVFRTLDLYKEVILYSEGKDLESEAEAFSSMGKIFMKYLNNKKKAQVYFHQSINLAMALRPKMMEYRKWFQSAKKRLEHIQKEIRDSEDKKLKEERDKLAVIYAVEVEELENQTKFSLEKFLQFLFEKYKRPDSENLKENLKGILEGMKKQENAEELQKKKKTLLLKTIKAFHPDKTSDAIDLKSRFFYGEIIRILNDKYTMLYKS